MSLLKDIKSLHDDVKLAWQLLDSPLSNRTKPTEREARAAVRRVLNAAAAALYRVKSGNEWADAAQFLWMGLADALDPTEDVAVLRKAEFTDMTTAIRRALAATHKNTRIASEVYLLNKTGQPGVSLIAKRNDKDPSHISRIYNEHKQSVKLMFGEITASQAIEELKKLP